jgi:hypothetical protein
MGKYYSLITHFIIIFLGISFFFSCGSEIEHVYIDILPHTVYEFSYPVTEQVELTPRMVGFLDQFIVELQNNIEFNLIIFGHSDKSKSLKLDEQRAGIRADKALNYLKSKGLNQDRVKIINKSSEEPITKNNSPNSQALNRRIGFKLTY